MPLEEQWQLMVFYWPGFMSANVYFQFVITLVQVGNENEVFFPRYQVVKFNISFGVLMESNELLAKYIVL